MKKDLTKGPVFSALISLAVPITFANILQSVYQLTDTFWVGRLGAEAVAAVSISFPIMFLLISFGGGLATAGTVLVAQYTGKQEKKNADHTATQTLLMMIFSAVLISILGYLLSPFLLNLIGVDPTVARGALSYLRVSFAGLVFLFGYFVFQSLMRGVGDVITPLFIVLGTMLLNLILDPLFIYGWGPIPAMGVAGAAVATVTTQGLATVVGLGMLFSGRYGVHIHWRDLFHIDTPLVQKMFRLGLPSSVEQSTRALGLIMMTFLVASFGTTTLAAYGIGSRILGFIIIPAIGLSVATSTLVGQNIGAGKQKRAEQTTWLAAGIGFVVLTGIGVAVFIGAEVLARLFIPGNTAAIAESALFIRIMALTFGLIGVQQVISGALRGSGNTLMAMILGIVALWVLQFPLAYTLSQNTPLGAHGIWWAFPIGNIVAALIALLWFSRGSWKKKSLTDEYALEEKVSEEIIIEEGMQ